MLCISSSAKYRLVLRPGGKPNYTAKGDILSIDRDLEAEFQPGGGLPLPAQEEALRRFAPFRGLPQGVEPLERIGWFDSEIYAKERNLSPEDKAVVERRLLELNGDGFFIFEQQKLAPPWPAYDKLVAQGSRTVAMVAERIAAKVTEDEYDPAVVIAYERENLNRPAVVAALERLTEAEPVEPETVVAA